MLDFTKATVKGTGESADLIVEKHPIISVCFRDCLVDKDGRIDHKRGEDYQYHLQDGEIWARETEFPYDRNDVPDRVYKELGKFGVEVLRDHGCDFDMLERCGLGSTVENPATKDEIISALDKLSPNNNNHWTQMGKPRLDVVSALVGKQVTRREIDAVALNFARTS